MGGGLVPVYPIRVGAIEYRAGTESQSRRVYSPEGKSTALCAGEGGAGARTGLYAVPSPLNYAPPPGKRREAQEREQKKAKRKFSRGAR